MDRVAVYRMCDTNHSVRRELCQIRGKDVSYLADICIELRKLAHNYPELAHMTIYDMHSKIKIIWQPATILDVMNNDNVFSIMYDYSEAMEKFILCLVYLGKEKLK